MALAFLLERGGFESQPGLKLFAQSQDFQKQKNMHKMDKLARYFPKVGNSEYFSRKKLCQNKIGRFHLKHPVLTFYRKVEDFWKL